MELVLLLFFLGVAICIFAAHIKTQGCKFNWTYKHFGHCYYFGLGTMLLCVCYPARFAEACLGPFLPISSKSLSVRVFEHFTTSLLYLGGGGAASSPHSPLLARPKRWIGKERGRGKGTGLTSRREWPESNVLTSLSRPLSRVHFVVTRIYLSIYWIDVYFPPGFWLDYNGVAVIVIVTSCLRRASWVYIFLPLGSAIRYFILSFFSYFQAPKRVVCELERRKKERERKSNNRQFVLFLLFSFFLPNLSFLGYC